MARPRVLFTTPVLEHPPAGGPQLRIENSIKALARTSELHVVARLPCRRLGGPDAERYLASLCASFSYSPSGWETPGLRGRILRKLAREVPALDGAYLLHCIERLRPDVVWFGYGNISYPLIRWLKRQRPGLPVVCDTDSVWSRFVLRGLRYESGSLARFQRWRSGQRKIREERAWTRLCETTTAVSEVDAEYYRSLTPEKERVRLFANVIDLQSYRPPFAQTSGLQSPSVYLAGSFGPRSPMEEGARWLIEKVLPIAWRQRPDLHLYIAGSGSKETLGHVRDGRISTLGKLPSLIPYLTHADVAVVPLHFESGTRFKILEAAACRVPVVSTALGAEGLPFEHGRQIWISDSPEGFADGVLRLLTDRDLARRYTEAAFRTVETQFSIEALTGQARQVLAGTIGSGPGRGEPLRARPA